MRPTSTRERERVHLKLNTLFCKLNNKSITHSNLSKINMNDDCILSSPPQKENGEWPTPVRKVVRSLQRDGLSQRAIVKKTTLPRRTIRRILHQEKSKRCRKKTLPRPHLMTQREIRQCIRHISRDWSTRRLTFDQVKAQLGITASARTIRREFAKSRM